MNFSCLSEAEIREKYRRADDKYEMLKILAELTCCSKDDMMAFLGVTVKPAPKKGRRPPQPMNKALARQYYDAGMSDRDISKALGVTRSCVSEWRRRIGLEPHTNVAAETAKRLEEYERMYREGHSDGYIGRATGVRSSTVAAWRTRHGLPPNFKRGQYDRRTVTKNG